MKLHSTLCVRLSLLRDKEKGSLRTCAMCTLALCSIYKCVLLRWGWGDDREKHVVCAECLIHRLSSNDMDYREWKIYVCCSFCFKPIDNILCLIGFMSHFGIDMLFITLCDGCISKLLWNHKVIWVRRDL